VGTLQSNNSPSSRVEVGNHLLSAAAALGARTKPIAVRLTTFRKTHATYAKADGAVKRADEKVRAQQAKVGEADVLQDEGVDTLASTLVGEGLPRLSPFKPFGFGPPGAIKKMGYGAEAEEVLRLADAVHKRKPALVKSKQAATALAAAAKQVQATIVPLDKLLATRSAAISKRDALEQAWETAFASLKRGARAAEDDGAAGLFDALFGSGPVVKKAAARKSAAKRKKKNGATETTGGDK
jgi:hypothetical protein